MPGFPQGQLLLTAFYSMYEPYRLSWWISTKESTCNPGDADLIPAWGRSPGGGHGNPLNYSCLEESHGQRRSLAGYSP